MRDPHVAIEAAGLVKRYGDFTAVDQVSLTVPAGTVYAVLGPNGAGKTTTVRMLATLLRPTGGTARVFGHDVVAEATAVRSLIGVTGQYASVDEDLTATENLLIFARLLGFTRRAARARAAELLEEFSLTAEAGRPLKHFSGGMRRRLDLAATLISRPPLIFLDEPTTGLDPRTRVDMWNTVRALVAQGSTVLLTTQYLEEADELADRIAVIDRGALVADGTADELKALVGASVLRLTLIDPGHAGAAAQVLHRALGSAVETAGDTLTAAAPDTGLVAEALLALRRRKIGVRDLSVDKPDLNEVFFQLTGTKEAA